MKKLIGGLDFVIYWCIILIPFSIAIAPAPASVFMGLLLASFLIKKLLKREHIAIHTAINWPLFFLFLITCISLLNSVNYRDTVRGGILRLFHYIFVLFVVVEELRDRKHINKVILSILAGMLLVSVDGIWQVITGKDFIRGYEPIINLGLVRAKASFKDANLLGIYLSALAPLLFGLTLYYLQKNKKIIAIFVSLIILTGILLTYSRPTLLAIYISLWLLSIVRKDKVLIRLLIILTLVSPLILPKSIKIWAREVGFNPLRFMCNDDRIAVYRNSLHMIKDHPIIGVGANTYMKNYKKYKEFPEYRNVVTLDYMYAHNNFLHMAGEIGLAGLAIFIWLIFKLFAECGRIYRALNDRYLKIISLSLCACLIAFLVNGLTESSLYYSRVALLFWYVAGFSLALKKFIVR